MFLSKPLTAMWHKSPHNPLSFMRYTVCVTPGSGLNDGQWHSVELLSRRGHLSVTLNGEDGAFAHASPPFLVTTGSHLFFGGKSNTCMTPHCSGMLRAVCCLVDWLMLHPVFRRLPCRRKRPGVYKPLHVFPGMHASADCGQPTSRLDQDAAKTDGKLQSPADWHVWHHW